MPETESFNQPLIVDEACRETPQSTKFEQIANN